MPVDEAGEGSVIVAVDIGDIGRTSGGRKLIEQVDQGIGEVVVGDVLWMVKRSREVKPALPSGSVGLGKRETSR